MHPTPQPFNRHQRACSVVASSLAGLLLTIGLVVGLDSVTRMPVASAASITVTTFTDELNIDFPDGDCSLREAIQAANTDTPVDACGAGSGADIIHLPSGIYNLTIPGIGEANNATGSLDITGTLTLYSPEMATINANGLDLALYVLPSATVTTLTLSNLTIYNGCCSGGLLANGQAVVLNTTFMSNTATPGCGGGAYFAGAATVIGTTFISNTADCGGGAYFWGPTTMTGTTFMNNTAGGGGGAWFVGTATVTGTTFISNTAGYGGAIYFFGVGVSTGNFANVLLAANRATINRGAGLYAENQAGDDTVTLRHTTIASPTVGGGSAVYVRLGTVNITDTLIASYTIGLESVDGTGTLNENYNLFSNVTTPYTGTVISGGNSITGVAAFADTTSYKLSGVSAAIDAGTDVGVMTDFEGDPRPFGAGFDIGWDEVFSLAIRAIYLPLISR